MKTSILLFFLLYCTTSYADSLCFSPVQEKTGDKDTKRSYLQKFDYSVQIDEGPIIKPNPDKSTSYTFHSERPLVKIYLGNKITESFYIEPEQIATGKNCIYFKNIYETWSLVETWQAEILCNCE